jgi:hypothetical protein
MEGAGQRSGGVHQHVKAAVYGRYREHSSVAFVRALSRRLLWSASVALPNTAARLSLFWVVSGLKSRPRNRWNWPVSRYLGFQFC